MSTINLGNYFKTFNGSQYSMVFIIYTNDISLTAASIQTEDLTEISEKGSIIQTDNVLSFEFENSIADIIPSAVLDVRDVGFLITNKLKTQNTRILALISHKISEKNTQDLKMNFVVSNYKVVEINQQEIHYKIFLELDTSLRLNSICQYATVSSLELDNDSLENPYEIAKNILDKANYPLYPAITENENGDIVQSRYSLPYTNEKCHFITKQNMTVLDSLKYLLSVGIGENGLVSPAYFIHNLIDGKGFITSMQNLWQTSSIDQQNYKSYFPFSITEITLPSKEFIATNIDTNSQNSGVNTAKLMFNYHFFEFDQTTRQWDNYTISKTTINDTLTKGITPSTETSIYLNMLNEDLEFSKYYSYPTHSHPAMYDIMKMLELYSSNFCFTIDGMLSLDVGQIININDSGNNGSKLEQFHGLWVIVKVRHTFERQKYKTHLICARRYYSSKENL